MFFWRSLHGWIVGWRRTVGLTCSEGGRLARFGGEDRDGLGSAGPGVVALERVEREAHADGFVIFVAASEEMCLALFRRPRLRACIATHTGIDARDAGVLVGHDVPVVLNRIPKVRGADCIVLIRSAGGPFDDGRHLF